MAKERSTNLLALPKRKELWECFVAPEGYEVAQFDINALEPHVLTYMTQDKNLMKIYGNDSKPHCVYLFCAAHFPSMKDKVLEHYSLDDNISEEHLDNVKKILKNERKEAKAPYLGWCYGLGANTLAFNKQISFFEAKSILSAIDRAFPGKMKLHNYLVGKWKENNGYVINGRGRPICVPADKLKDIINRVVQSTGVDILNRILFHLWNYIEEHNLPVIPYIPNIHDESVNIVKLGNREAYVDAVSYAFDKINAELGWNVTIKHGGVSFGPDISIRCE